MKYKNMMAAALSLLAMTSCLDSGDETIVLAAGDSTDIPSDDIADPNPALPGLPTAVLPDIFPAAVDEDGETVLRIDMQGIRDRATLRWLRLYGTGDPDQNVWLELDGDPKAIKVRNTIAEGDASTVPVDLVLLVDNAPSMSEEADAMFAAIHDWTFSLSASGMDIRFGCVGYDGRITGAVNLTSWEGLDEYLHRPAYTGVNSTFGFVGSEDEINAFRSKLPLYDTGEGNPCGMAALRFAGDLFSFRKDANRIYVNFTDQPNRPDGHKDFSVESLLTDWSPARGVIHTVFSGKSDNAPEPNYLMSDYTDGTVMNVSQTFTGVNLSALPVSDAPENSYIIRLANVDKYIDGKPHDVRITVISADNAIRAERTYSEVFRR